MEGLVRELVPDSLGLGEASTISNHNPEKHFL